MALTAALRGGVAAGLLGASAHLAGSAAQAGTVQCHDPGRGIVQEVLAQHCAGEAVTEARADEIRARNRRERARMLTPGSKSPPRRAAGTRYGTAFPVDAGGHLLTANHVVDDCGRIEVQTPAGDRHDAALVGTASTLDLALLRSPLRPKPFLLRAPDAPPQPEEPVTAIGYPNRGLPVIRPLESGGTIVAAAPPGAAAPAVVFRSPIRGGNSGGPLLDAQARLVGVVVAKIDTVAVFAKYGETVRDVAVATASHAVAEFLSTQGVTPVPEAEAGDGNADTIASRVLRVICTAGDG